jgi:hypothetical protein
LIEDGSDKTCYVILISLHACEKIVTTSATRTESDVEEDDTVAKAVPRLVFCHIL